MSDFPFVITVSSEKGGVGKTTLATNLAIFLKAMREDLQISIFSFDNHYTVDKMFAHKGQQHNGTIAELLTGVRGCELLHTGQYGINYIPSSSVLPEIRSTVQGPMHLARLLATSGIPGIVIIDTRPELDVLTQNALYAADMVFIPVKDMASLENCRNIFALFDSRGLDKKNLSLIPCLIDSRVKFDGVFRDQKALLKAFAMNRGFHCLDVSIAKSPKVDSLNTNPEGKIYPILTHAKGTEVFGQFIQIANQVLANFSQTAECRSKLFYNWLASEEERRKATYLTRKSSVKPHCPVCGSSLSNGHSAGLYYEAGNSARGFINADCFYDLIMNLIMPNSSVPAASTPLTQLLTSSMSSATFVFRMSDGNGTRLAEFTAIDGSGQQLLQQSLALGDFAGSFMNRREGRLHQMLTATLGNGAAADPDSLLIVHPVDTNSPESILTEEPYRKFRKLRQRITDAFLQQ